MLINLCLSVLAVLPVLVLTQVNPPQSATLFANSSIQDKVQKLSTFSQNQDPKKLKELEDKFGEAKQRECAELLKDAGNDGAVSTEKMSKKKKKKKKKNFDDEESEGSEGLLGGLEQLTNFGNLGAPFKNSPAAFACYIRTPLNVVVGLLDEVTQQLRFIQGQRKKRRKDRPKPKAGCDCDPIGPDPTLPGQLATTLETAVVALRHVLKLVNILLVTPGGGLCSNNNDDFGKDIGEMVGSFLPLTAIGK